MDEHGGGLTPIAVVVGLLGLLAAVAYLAAVRGDAHRRRWPALRTVAWLGGVAVLLAGSVGPIATAAHRSFALHAVGHLLVGMLGPLLLVLGTPVTLALRTLPPCAARRLARALRSRPLRLLTEPLVAAVLNVGGLWLLYTTPLLALAQQHGGVHLLVHLHLVLTGYLLPAVLVGRDPLPHRRPYAYRAAVLVAALAAHGILAKYLYTRPPPGLGVGGAETGAMIMYYGGDAVELVVIILLCRRWFGAGPRRGAAALDPAPAGSTANLGGR
jgi:putative membrane protein